MLVISLFITTACATMTKDISVDSEMDTKANMSGYKTYAWLGAAAIMYDPEGRWEPPNIDLDAEIKYQIDSNLRKRGITEVAMQPDLIVAYAAGIDMTALKLSEDAETKLPILKNVPKGALAVILIDSGTGEPVWVGVAQGDIKEDPPVDVVKKRLSYAVDQMFKKLPN